MNRHDIVKLPLSCSSLCAYLIGESLLLYSKSTQSVYGFEKGDAYLFLKIDELINSCSYQEIVERFPTVDATLLKKMYDFANCAEVVDSIEYESDIEAGVCVEDDLSRVFYRLDDVLFAISYPNGDLFKSLHPVYEHLHVNKQDAKIIISVDFIKRGDLWGVKWNNTPVEMEMPEARLATYIQDQMRTYVYQAQSYLISLHSASVEKDDKVLVMPAVAESGKTTLTATLLHKGFKLFSDEVTVMDFKGYIHPLPFCMNVKEGSWTILKEMYPHLHTKDVHSRFDNQNIRFLPPENIQKERKKATYIVFPKYIQNAKTSLVALSATDTLLKIKEAHYQVQHDMDQNKFELILKNLISLPSYMLEYSNLEEAEDLINKLISEG